jgi:hypothetical protein
MLQRCRFQDNGEVSPSGPHDDEPTAMINLCPKNRIANDNLCWHSVLVDFEISPRSDITILHGREFFILVDNDNDAAGEKKALAAGDSFGRRAA